MYQIKDKTIKISVRSLVEFILRSGDLDNRNGGRSDIEAMQEGSRIHRMIQKQMGQGYSAEVPLSITIPVAAENMELCLSVEGRADGIIFRNLRNENSENNAFDKIEIIIDEIKGVYLDLEYINEPVPVHRAQVMCYAYIYAVQNNLNEIGIRLTYCNIETNAVRYFEEAFSCTYLEEWFQKLVKEYSKWAIWQYEWIKTRNGTIKKAEFPFPYRPGQKELVTGVYKTIIREKKLFLEAPTGVGKTISTVFPAVKSMAEGFASKIFYLTAKTITRTVAEDTFHILMDLGMHMKVVTITAKEKICILEKSDCNPAACERAAGHYDRVNDAVFDLLTNENDISRELILFYAEKHRVCPFEMCLDVTTWADSIICDYNYAFDPKVYLRRFFVNEKKNDYIFLVDEAHNLVDRAREMYSAVLYKEIFLEVKKIIKTKGKKLEKKIDTCNKDLLLLKRECDDCRTVENISDFILHLMRLLAEYEEFLQEHKQFDDRDKVLQSYLDVRHFLNIYDLTNEKYIIYTDYDETGNFRVKLQCMDPSDNLLKCLEKGKSTVFFSATLLPIKYYKEQLGGNAEDYAVYAPSPFDTKNRLLMIAGDVSTRYTKRSESEYRKIGEYILEFTGAKLGNYMVFFPSYHLMNEIAEQMESDSSGRSADIVIQGSSMTETEREEFLGQFTQNPTRTRIGFCVMGGIFSEGIDLKEDRLIGAVIVGTGLPMVCNERELFRNYYETRCGCGFDYAYLYQGMNKVLQSAGRVIRTSEDKGAILLLDERFRNTQYVELFPREWFPHIFVNRKNMKQKLKEFWSAETD